MKTSKLFWLLGSLCFTPLAITSCVNYEKKEQFEKYIDQNLDYYSNFKSDEINKTQEILDKLLKLVYKNDESSKVEFLKQQSSSQISDLFYEVKQKYLDVFARKNELELQNEELVKELKVLEFFANMKQVEIAQTKERIKANNDKLLDLNFKQMEYLEQVDELINQNWYWFLSNINAFEFESFKLLSIQFYSDLMRENNNNLPDEFAQIFNSNYLNSLQETKLPKKKIFLDSYLDNLQFGEESKELNNSVIYYLAKDKMVFRIVISNLNYNNANIKIAPFIWYFANSKNPKLSLNLISSINHYALIHKYASGYKQYVYDLVKKQRYGEASLVLPIIKE